jgi:hypothetical protein
MVLAGSFGFNAPSACQSGWPWPANTVTRSCELSLPSFARPVAFSEPLWQFFSLWVCPLNQFSPPEVALSSWVSGRPRTHAYEQGDGQFKHPSLASFEYELPSALRRFLLRRAGFLILNLQIIHDLRHVGYSSCHLLGERTLVFRVHLSG